MIFGVMKKYNIQLFFFIVSCLCSGCAVVRFTTEERLNDKKINKEIFDSFYVEDLIEPQSNTKHKSMTGYLGFQSMYVLRKEINQLLIDNFPNNFDRTNGIPLHIEVEYEPISFYSKGYAFFFAYIFYRQNKSSYIDISIKIPNAEKLATARVDYCYSKSISITPIALFVPGKSSFGVRLGNSIYMDDYRDIYAELISIGIIDVINNLEAHELQSLRDSYLISENQKKSLLDVARGSVKTVKRKINEEGEIVYVENEHNYQIKENVVQFHFPKIIKQNFDGARNRGLVVANVTNCSDIESNRYLREFLIPTICLTKNLVFTLNKMEIPSGAKFKIIKDVIREEKGNKIREIEFEAVE